KERVTYKFKAGNKYEECERHFYSKFEKNVAIAFLIVKNKKAKWIDSLKMKSKDLKSKPTTLINERNRPFLMNVAGYVGENGAGFAVIVRHSNGIPIYAFHSSSDGGNASLLEIDAVYKALEMGKELDIKHIRIYCTRKWVANKVNSHLCEVVTKDRMYMLIKEILEHFVTYHITYRGKLSNQPARHLAKHGEKQGWINVNQLCLDDKLVDMLYNDAAAVSGVFFA
ncbi:hypothetical protein MKW92_020884, partial [Papaver armeniacum]